MSNKDVTGQPTTSDVVRLDDISIRYKESECYITGIAVLTPNILIISDHSEESVKLVDVMRKVVIENLTLPNCPRDITLMGEDRAAVTLPDARCIRIVKIDECNGTYSLSLDTSLSVEGECSGIDYDQSLQCFAVCFTDPVKLELIRENGTVVWSLGSELHIERPLYVKFSRNTDKMVLVTDTKTNKIIKVSVDKCAIVPMMTQLHIQDARALSVLSDDSVLLCGKNSHNICLIAENGNFIRTVVNKGLDHPCAFAYCEQEQKIYVSCKLIGGGLDIWGFIRVFKIKDMKTLYARQQSIPEDENQKQN